MVAGGVAWVGGMEWLGGYWDFVGVWAVLQMVERNDERHVAEVGVEGRSDAARA